MERVWNLCHDGRHGRCWNQRERLGDPGREEGPVKRICDGELLQEEEVHSVGVAAGLTPSHIFIKKTKLKDTSFRSPKFSSSTYNDNPLSTEHLTSVLLYYYELHDLSQKNKIKSFKHTAQGNHSVISKPKTPNPLFSSFSGEMLTGLSFRQRTWATLLVSAWATRPRMVRKWRGRCTGAWRRSSSRRRSWETSKFAAVARLHSPYFVLHPMFQWSTPQSSIWKRVYEWGIVFLVTPQRAGFCVGCS